MKIAILSRGRTLYSTNRIAEVGRRRKHDVRVLDPARCCVGLCDGALQLTYDGLPLDNVDLAIPRIGASTLEQGLPVLRQFELMNIPVINHSSAILLSKDKVAAHQILVANGVPIPRTMACRDPAQVPAIIEALGGPPVIIKVTRGTHGAGVVVAESQASAASILDTIWSFQGEALVQEYIKESDGEDIRVFVVGDRAVGAMKRRAADGDFRANLHLGGTSEIIQLTDELRDLATRTTAVLGLDVAGVDILLSDRGPLVLEANASPGLQGIESTTRLDIARYIIMLAESMVGLRTEAADRIGNI